MSCLPTLLLSFCRCLNVSASCAPCSKIIKSGRVALFSHLELIVKCVCTYPLCFLLALFSLWHVRFGRDLWLHHLIAYRFPASTYSEISRKYFFFFFQFQDEFRHVIGFFFLISFSDTNFNRLIISGGLKGTLFPPLDVIQP